MGLRAARGVERRGGGRILCRLPGRLRQPSYRPEAARLVGFQHTGAKIRAAVGEAIAAEVRAGRLVEAPDGRIEPRGGGGFFQNPGSISAGGASLRVAGRAVRAVGGPGRTDTEMEMTCCQPGPWAVATSARLSRRLARVRQRQLDLALRGDVVGSAVFARKARSLRRVLDVRDGRRIPADA